MAEKAQNGSNDATASIILILATVAALICANTALATFYNSALQLPVEVRVGVAHGIQALEDDVETTYMTNAFYAPEHERGCRWDDPRLAIAWPIGAPNVIVSEKDGGYPPLAADFAGVRL